MGKKLLLPLASIIIKPNFLGDKYKVVPEDVVNHPHCQHGPTLLFARTSRNSPDPEFFYGCSACRSRKECPVWIPKDDGSLQPRKSNWSEKHFKFGLSRRTVREKVASLFGLDLDVQILESVLFVDPCNKGKTPEILSRL